MRPNKMWKIAITVLTIFVLITLYTKNKNKKAEAEYVSLFTQACTFATSGLKSVDEALNSKNLSLVEKLKMIQNSERELGVASRYLESIALLEPGLHLDPPDEIISGQFLQTIVDGTLEDATYIAIAQEDFESQENGTAEDGLRAIKQRLNTTQSFCREYLN